MAYTRFNGATATLTTAANSEIASAVGITSFSVDSGGRAEIDVTDSVSNVREVVPGFNNPRRISIGLILEDPTLAELEGMITECDSGLLVVSFGQDCADVASFLSLPVFLMNYSVNGQLDGVLDVTCEFMVDERPAV